MFRTPAPFAVCLTVVMSLAAIACTGASRVDTRRIPVSELPASSTSGEEPVDPLNASYRIEGRTIRLLAGRSEMEAAPGSSTREITAVFGNPVFGNISGASFLDAALILSRDPGGTGTFYYVAAALHEDGRYRGTNAVLLGDRVAPQAVEIRNGVVTARYADRRPGEPMAAPPSVAKTVYLTLDGGELSAVPPLAEGEQLLEGWVVVGHEVRSFSPCFQERDLWLMGTSPALGEITARYRNALPDAMPYAPLFMTLAGRIGVPPPEGFGAEYKGAFHATRLVRVSPKGNCRSDRIVVDSPVAGSTVSSPLQVRGHARGNWFFEGDFPLVLLGPDGKILARKYATAKGAWMTREFVPFEGTLEFDPPPSGGKGTLILRKNNPSDDRKLDDHLAIPVHFRGTSE